MEKRIAAIKSLIMMTMFSVSAAYAQGPAGYTRCAGEGESYTLAVRSDVAYGANGNFNYLYNQTGTVTFNNAAFGDPAPGAAKSGYYKVVDVSQEPANLSAALTKIKDHLSGAATLTAAQIIAQTQIIQDNVFAFGYSEAIINQAFDIASYYETNKGPIFVNAATKNYFANDFKAADGFELVRAVFRIQQGLHDYAFTSENLAKYPTLFDGKKFKTADYFPGACAAPANPGASYTVAINGSMPEEWGRRTAFSSTPAPRPTGYYLAPGSIGIVTVPASMVNKGFTVQVGAHCFDRTGNNPIKRFFHVSKRYPITNTDTRIANPFGGGVYIVVPYKASQGTVDVKVTNVVAAPFFSAQRFNKTTLAQWQTTQRKNPGPWADFVSDKFMMQVPTGWIYNYNDAVALMQHWDMRMDGVSELLGFPLIRNNYVLWEQIDVDIMWGVYGIGYPQINNAYNPNDATDGNSNHWFLHANRDFWDTDFHELGHSELFSDFPGETEAANNMLAAMIWNTKYGMDIDTALGKSFWNHPQISRDQAALNWMTTPNFRAGKPMDISNTTRDEVRYQQRGYAKYIEIAALFGWDVIGLFYYQENQFVNANTPIDGGIDDRIFRLSVAAGVDLRPLIHFWGVQPVNANALRDQIAARGLKPSSLIYDRLVHYKTIIPLNNAEFRTHAGTFLNKDPASINAAESPDYGEGWYYVWLPQYNETHGAVAQTALQNIIDLYFPGMRPTNETTPPTPNPATFASATASANKTAITLTATTGSDPNGPVLYRFTETSGNPGATSSFWQFSPAYVDSQLTPGLTYTYTVTMRDAFANRGNPSTLISVNTDPATDLTPTRVGAVNFNAVITPKGIDIRTQGRHTVTMYTLNGRLIRVANGIGPAHYPMGNVFARGIYIVHIVTLDQNVRQTLFVY